MKVTDEMIENMLLGYRGQHDGEIRDKMRAGLQAVLDLIAVPDVGAVARTAYERGQADQRSIDALFPPSIGVEHAMKILHDNGITIAEYGNYLAARQYEDQRKDAGL